MFYNKLFFRWHHLWIYKIFLNFKRHIYVIVELLHLWELPNICIRFEVRTGINNKKLSKESWENKLQLEILKSFWDVKKLWTSFCQQDIKCKGNPQFLSTNFMICLHIFPTPLFFFGELREGGTLLLMFIYIYDSVHQRHLISPFSWRTKKSKNWANLSDLQRRKQWQMGQREGWQCGCWGCLRVHGGILAVDAGYHASVICTDHITLGVL